MGTRLKKTSSGQTTKYLGGNYEIAPDGTVTKYLVGGKKVGAVFYKHHRDHLGSIQVVTNWLGNEVRRQKHKPFGDQHFVSGTHAESKGWIGEREEETELLYLNARFFDPEIGRFTAPDAVVRLGQGLNRYSYAWNNPINLADPAGLDPIDCTKTPELCTVVTPESICELNPYCRNNPNNDPSFLGWTSESETALVEIQERQRQRQLATYVDCTQLGVDCGPPPCAAFGTCPQGPDPGADPPVDNGSQPDNPL